jgi:hypothetical protein
VSADWVSALANVVIAFAAIAAACAAFKGLDTWRQQTIWQRDHELARKCLVALYSLRDRVYEVRYPFIYENEVSSEKEEDEELMRAPSSKMRRAYGRRFSRVNEAQIEVQALLRESDAIWGGSVSNLYKKVHELNHELFMTVSFYLDEISATDPEMRKELREVRKKKRDILRDTMDETDEFRVDYNSALLPIESYLASKLGRVGQ